MKFLVNLIVINKKQSKKAIQSLEDNCTFVCNSLYIMEGDIGCMLDDELDFNLIDIGEVGCLRGKDTKELIAIAERAFNVDVEKLKYEESKKYNEEE